MWIFLIFVHEFLCSLLKNQNEILGYISKQNDIDVVEEKIHRLQAAFQELSDKISKLEK